ncbi:MAG: hypothetical protein BroJett038_33870 [Chloroflexota bacterium]|nr:MAG: hypothetical protein BroJett038_33870 [Chloroflexota bacterium]
MTGEFIFISHASGDDAIVTRLHDALEGAGLDAWVDHLDITGSDNWNQEIQTALHARPYCVFVLSPESAANANCEAEWWHFLNQPDRRLYVALVAPVEKKTFPWRLKTVQYVDLLGDFDRGIKTLIAAIQGRRDLCPDDPAARAETRITGPFPYGDLDVPMRGRDADLREVKRLLLEEGRRLVVLTATGGTGKTRLAVDLAVTAAEFTGGVLWLRLNDKTTEDDLAAALRQHLTLPPTDPPDAVWAALSGARVLLVLDNAESVPAAHRAAIARRLEHYPTTGGARAVMTSREQWRECRHFNCAYPLERLTPEAAEQIARDMAKAQGYEALMQGREREFAEKAHCHPRLMKYAVGWLAENSLNAVLRMLETHTGEDMQAVLEDVLHSTLRQLENSAGAGVVADFKRLLVCRGGFTEAAAEALTGAGSPSLGALRRWNLLQLDRERYTPDLLAEAVLEPDESANPAHYDYYYALAGRHDRTQDYLGLAVESDNLAAAFDWAMRSGRPEKAYWLYEACSDFLANRGQFGRMRAWLEKAAGALAGVEDAALHASVQNSLGNLYVRLPTGSRRENLKRAIGCYEAALVYRTAEAAPLDYAMTQNNLGNAYRDLAGLEERAANLKRAIGCYEAALVYRTAEAAPLDYAMTQGNLGWAYDDLGDSDKRDAAWNEAEKYFRLMGHTEYADRVKSWLSRS